MTTLRFYGGAGEIGGDKVLLTFSKFLTICKLNVNYSVFGDYTRIEIEIPSENEILQSGRVVRAAPGGESWSGSQLGEHASDSGVYVIHHGGSIKRVGKAIGKSFAGRLSSEFREKSTQGDPIYSDLAGLAVPPEIKVTLLPLTRARELVHVHDGELDDKGRAAVLEQALIHVYHPPFNRELSRPARARPR